MNSYSGDPYNNSDMVRKIKEKIRKIITTWNYKYAIVGKIKKNTKDTIGSISLDKFWVELYISKEIPPKEVIKKAKSIKDLDKYNLRYVCTQAADILAEAYINLLRYVELMDISIKSLQTNKKQQNDLN